MCDHMSCVLMVMVSSQAGCTNAEHKLYCVSSWLCMAEPHDDVAIRAAPRPCGMITFCSRPSTACAMVRMACSDWA